ncbi:MAG: hypothetical protein HY460_00160 [Parcubacteria group bacterium]|nr:hypothetical protein [Parcubacteria group bacterium]
MGNLVRETPYSEITATLEKLDQLGVRRDDLVKLRQQPRLARTAAALLMGGLKAISTEELDEDVKPALKVDKRMQLKLGKLLTVAIYDAGLGEDQIAEVLQGWDTLRAWLTHGIMGLIPPLVVHTELQLGVDGNTPVSEQVEMLIASGVLKRSNYGGARFTDFPDPTLPRTSNYYLVHPKRDVDFEEAQGLIRNTGYVGASLRELCAFIRLTQASTYKEFNGVTAFGTLHESYVLFIFAENNTWELWTRAAGFSHDSLFLVKELRSST